MSYFARMTVKKTEEEVKKYGDSSNDLRAASRKHMDAANLSNANSSAAYGNQDLAGRDAHSDAAAHHGNASDAYMRAAACTDDGDKEGASLNKKLGDHHAVEAVKCAGAM